MVSFTLKFASTSFSFSLMFCQSMSLSNSNRCRLFNSSYVAVSISNVPLYYFVPLILSLFFTPYSLHPYAHFNRHTLFPPPHPRSTKNNIHKQSQSEQHNMEAVFASSFSAVVRLYYQLLDKRKVGRSLSTFFFFHFGAAFLRAMRVAVMHRCPAFTLIPSILDGKQKETKNKRNSLFTGPNKYTHIIYSLTHSRKINKTHTNTAPWIWPSDNGPNNGIYSR